MNGEPGEARTSSSVAREVSVRTWLGNCKWDMDTWSNHTRYSLDMECRSLKYHLWNRRSKGFQMRFWSPRPNFWEFDPKCHIL